MTLAGSGLLIALLVTTLVLAGRFTKKSEVVLTSDKPSPHRPRTPLSRIYMNAISFLAILGFISSAIDVVWDDFSSVPRAVSIVAFGTVILATVGLLTLRWLTQKGTRR